MSATRAAESVTIERMGQRGEGIADTGSGRLYVPHALPGELVSVVRDGERGRIVDVLSPADSRIAPFCPHFGDCGGCAIQHWTSAPYQAWKRGLLVDALHRANVKADVGALVDAHGTGRRRAVFHARVSRTGTVDVGFMRSRAHEIVALDACPILDPGLAGALPAARAIAQALAGGGKPLDIIASATDAGLDFDLRGHGPLSEEARNKLIEIAAAHGLARLTNHGVVIVMKEVPHIAVGKARVWLPPGAFRQATAAGEEALAGRTVAALSRAKRVADLFAGSGTFALRLAETADVGAFDTEGPALAALDQAARSTEGLHQIKTERRDLFARPLTTRDLAKFDAVVLDPPRAGAHAQMLAIAGSNLQQVISISCDVQSFARDAAILCEAGFVAETVTPIDQFRHSAHLEIFAHFCRPRQKRQRTLFG